MSRHVLAAAPGFEVTIGWDARLGTYFAIVLSPSEEDADPWRLNVGTEPGEIKNPARVIELVRPYAQIPDDLLDQLAHEAAAAGAIAALQSWRERLRVLDAGAAAPPLDT